MNKQHVNIWKHWICTGLPDSGSAQKALLTQKTESKDTDLKRCRAGDEVLYWFIEDDHTSHDDSENHLC